MYSITLVPLVLKPYHRVSIYQIFTKQNIKCKNKNQAKSVHSGCPRSDILSVYKMNGEMFDFFD